MKNLLLIFLNDLEDINGLNEMLDKFDEETHIIELMNNIKKDKNFDISSLSEIIDFFKKQHREIDKIIVLSNSRDLLLAWYRVYNSLVNDYIYFIDKDEKRFFDESNRHYEFYNDLSQFYNIKEETIHGKVYINITFDNYHKIIDFLIQKDNFEFFDDINYYNLNKQNIKEGLIKEYSFKKYNYLFEQKSIYDKEKIYIDSNYGTEFKINNQSVRKIVNSIYIIPYFTILSYKTNSYIHLNNLLMIFNKLKELKIDIKREVFEKLFDYVNIYNIHFKEKMYISSLLIIINNEDKNLTQFMMNTLLEDKCNLDYHYTILYNMLFYETNDNMQIYNNVYKERRYELIKLGEYFKDKGNIEIKKDNINNSNNLRIAIHYDQLLALNHSPTKLALDMAKNLKRYYPNYKVMIFIEDNFITKTSENILPYYYLSTTSSTIREIHKDYLEGYEVDIYYSNTEESKLDRTKEIVKEISEFNPDVIYSNSDLSIAREILYPYYPTIYVSHGGMNFSTLADKYILYKEIRNKIMDINKEINLIEESKIVKALQGIDISNPKKHINKYDYNIKDNEFILITVGNRLMSDMNEKFINTICNFINSKNDVKWIIVGRDIRNYIKEKYKEILIREKIILIDYEEDLAALYKISDVYVNPVRNGGGMSIAMAMNQGVAVLVTENSVDGVSWVGKKNSVKNEGLAYQEELELLYNDRNYLNEKKKLMLISINDRKGYKTKVNQLIEIINELKKDLFREKVYK